MAEVINSANVESIKVNDIIYMNSTRYLVNEILGDSLKYILITNDGMYRHFTPEQLYLSRLVHAENAKTRGTSTMHISSKDLDSLRINDILYLGSIRSEIVSSKNNFFTLYNFKAGYRTYEKNELWLISQKKTSRYVRRENTRKKNVKTPSIAKPKNNYSYVYSDGGRSVDYPNEDNDCGVRALAIAGGCSYKLAHNALTKQGRKMGHSTRISMITKTRDLPFEYFVTASIISTIGRKKTLGWWMESGLLPKRCIMTTRNHAIACIDNIIYDTFRTSSRSKINNILIPIKKSYNTAETYEVTKYSC
jgi:hypothetical protein